MDRMIYTAMSAAKQTMDQQSVVNNNLANVDTAGFRAQLHNVRAVPVDGAGVHDTRTSVAATTPGADFSPGQFTATGRDLDVALKGNGWLAVQAPDGGEAYTRRGDLRVNANSVLVNGEGRPVMGSGGGPVVIPPNADFFIGADGTVSMRAPGQPPNAVAEIDRLKMVEPQGENLLRGEDGLFRAAPGPDGQPRALPADESVRLTTGTLEGSNVSAVESMVDMINTSRRYDMQMNVITSAKENAQRGDSLLRLS